MVQKEGQNGGGYLIAFLCIKAIPFGINILFGSMGEITTEKSGNLNLGIPGMMYIGRHCWTSIGAFFMKTAALQMELDMGVLISFLCAFFHVRPWRRLVYSVLTITLRANQNVTGLALTTFGVGG